MSPTWSLGTIIGLPVARLLLLAALAAMVVSWIARKDTYDKFEMTAASVGAGACALVIAVIAVVAYWPFSAEYHRWEPRSGTVAAVSQRLLSDGDGGVNQKFVVRYAGDGREYGCEDTRCSLVERGDRLTLMCKRTWQYTGTDGYDCQFGSREPGR